MDLGSAIVGVIIIAISVIPFIIMNQGKKRKEKQMLNALSDIAKEQNCTISQHDFCGDFVIGYDQKKKQVFFYKNNKLDKQEQFVDLTHIQDCKVNRKNKKVVNMGGDYFILDTLQLCFITLNNNKEIQFEFYNSDINLQLSGELQMAEKWQKLIKSNL